MFKELTSVHSLSVRKLSESPATKQPVHTRNGIASAAQFIISTHVCSALAASRVQQPISDKAAMQECRMHLYTSLEPLNGGDSYT
jgi:hypothetical protein